MSLFTSGERLLASLTDFRDKLLLDSEDSYDQEEDYYELQESVLDSIETEVDFLRNYLIGWKAKRLQYRYAKELGVSVEKVFNVGGTSIVMCLIPPGSFEMGSPKDEPGHDEDNEWPIHEVVITKGFWIGKYPILQIQWQAVMGKNPSYFKNAGLSAPVESVSWYDCLDFCKKIGMRLPTEEEWEYACRAGNPGMTYVGDFDPLVRDILKLNRIAWHGENSIVSYDINTSINSRGRGTHKVGEKEPNAWGLYDMIGNVYEWCLNDFGLYSRGREEYDPSNFIFNVSKVECPAVRGGSWLTRAWKCRSAERSYFEEKEEGFHDVGLRVVKPIEDKGV